MERRMLYMPRERQRKRALPIVTRKKLLGGLVLILFFVSVAGVAYAFRYPSWQISDVSISGLQRISETDIRAQINSALEGNYAFLLPRRSYFLTSGKELQNDILREFPRMREVTVKKDFPSKLQVEVRERSFWSIFCAKDAIQCGYIDDVGVLYETAPVSFGSLIFTIISNQDSLTIPSQALPEEFISRLRELRSQLKEKTGEEVTRFIFSDLPDDEFRVSTRTGFLLYIKKDDDFTKVVDILKTFLEKEIGENRGNLEYVDLRFGNKIFYK